jgi:hypothetical protein
MKHLQSYYMIIKLSNIKVMKNFIMLVETKCIEIKHHYIREKTK